MQNYINLTLDIFMIFGGLWFACYVVLKWRHVIRANLMKPFYLYISIAIALCSIYLGFSSIVRELQITLP